MTTDPQNSSAGQDAAMLVIPYPSADPGRLVGAAVFGVLALLSANLVRVTWGDDGGQTLGVGGSAILALSMVFLLWVLALIIVPWWRMFRRTWWLRLTASGLEINEGLRRPVRYRWSDVERFFLAPTPIDLSRTDLARQQAYSDRVSDALGHGTLPTVVGLVPAFRLIPDYPRTFWHKRLNRRYRRWTGPTPDGLIAEYWDRPPDQAVALLNEWMTRHQSG